MPALNFQKQFSSLVESGQKCQTIRAKRKDGRDPKVGQTLYLYTGMRTKACRKLGEAVCTSVWPFELALTEQGGLFWILGEECQTNEECTAIAVADGFVDQFAMVDWFKKTHGLPFEGYLIKWDSPTEGA